MLKCFAPGQHLRTSVPQTRYVRPQQEISSTAYKMTTGSVVQLRQRSDWACVSRA